MMMVHFGGRGNHETIVETDQYNDIAVLKVSGAVLDVASVKMKPVELFDRHLAGRVPWAATHPLFGPASLSRRERPLRRCRRR